MLFRTIFLGVLAAAAVILPLGWVISGNRMGFFAGADGRGGLLAGGVGGFSSERAVPSATIGASPCPGGDDGPHGNPPRGRIDRIFCGGPLADAGFLYYLVVFYPVTLCVETFLSCLGPSPRKNVPPAQGFVA